MGYVSSLEGIAKTSLTFFFGKKFDNLSIKNEDCKSQSEYTKVTFFPDFPRFGMNGLDRWE